MNLDEVFKELISPFRKTKLSQATRDKMKAKVVDDGSDLTIGYDFSCNSSQSQCVPICCNKCGESRIHCVNNLLNKKFTCVKCTTNRYVVSLKEIGFEYTDRGAFGLRVKCYKCESVFNIKSVGVSRFEKGGKLDCKVCQENNYKELAISRNFTYVSRATTEEAGTCASLRCNIDNSITIVPIGQLHKKFIRCQLCATNKCKEALLKKKCKFISSEVRLHCSRRVRRVIYENEHGEIFEATAGAILSGIFAITTNNSWYQEHSTYLITTIYNGKKYCKIGTANDPEIRLKSLKLLGKTSVTVLERFSDRFEADRLESLLHNEFSMFKLDKSISSEFSTANVKVKGSAGIVRTVKDGISEWFTSDIEDIILERYSKQTIKDNNGINSYPTSKVTSR